MKVCGCLIETIDDVLFLNDANRLSSLIFAILLLVLRNLSTLTMRASCKFSVFCR